MEIARYNGGQIFLAGVDRVTKTRNLTLRYSLQQMTYWAVYAGPVSFAAAYLMAKGFRAAQVGAVLACANFFSCLLQPVLAGFADRAGGRVLPRLLTGLAAVSFSSFGAVLLLAPPLPVFAVLYLVGVLSFDVMVPLLNSVSVYYDRRGCSINYGVGRGVGSLAFAAAALGIGHVMEAAGADWMPRIELCLLVLFALLTLGYPKLDGAAPEAGEAAEGRRSSSLAAFVFRYPWYNLSLAGVLLLAVFHAMTENYLIEIVRRLGGDSGDVGIALFLATVTAVPALLWFDRIHARLSSDRILKIAGVMFTLKAVIFLAAFHLRCIYGAELLQTVTYGFLSPVQMYFARERVAPEDMVKGQAAATAAYALGCASGNLMGGLLIGSFGVTAMLTVGAAMAALGTLVLFLTVGRDKSK